LKNNEVFEKYYYRQNRRHLTNHHSKKHFVFNLSITAVFIILLSPIFILHYDQQSGHLAFMCL